MHRNVNMKGFKIEEKGLVWKIKVGIYSQVSKNSINKLEETKFWKIKVILN